MNKILLNEMDGREILPDNMMQYGEEVHLENKRFDRASIKISGHGLLRYGESVALRRDVDGIWHATFYRDRKGVKDGR